MFLQDMNMWRVGTLKCLIADGVAAQRYYRKKLNVSSSDVRALKIVEKRIMQDGFSRLVMNNHRWWTVRDYQLIRVFIEHESAIRFTLVTKDSMELMHLSVRRGKLKEGLWT